MADRFFDVLGAAGGFEMAREPSKAQRMIAREMLPADLVAVVVFMAASRPKRRTA